MEYPILKKLFVYTLLLIVVDLFINIILNLIQGNPGIVIAGSVILRVFFLLLFFPSVGCLMFLLFKNRGHYIPLFLTTITVYLMIPSVVYLLKSNNKNLMEVYIDLHADFYMFAIIFLPYILASFICVIVSSKTRLF